MTNNPDDHFSYGCFPRHNRRSPTAGGNNNPNAHHTGRRGFFSFGQGGRTVLPPLHLPFRSSRSPAPPDPSFSNQYAQQEAAQSRGEYDIPTYGQTGWNMNPSQQQHTSFSPGDPRYPAQPQAYPTYGRAPSTIPTDPHDTRILPPLSNQPGPSYQAIPQQAMATANHIRSPNTGYSSSYQPYPGQEQMAGGYGFPVAPDPRNLPPAVPTMAYDSASGAMIPRRSSLSVDRTSHRLSVHAPSPYARNPPSMGSTYSPEPISEPTIKKKRKRADAEQLKVLNETYNRTAFPSTEERIELAKKLGMSARSVQIWFQNKRQSMRQSTRQASTNTSPTTTEPFPTSTQQNPRTSSISPAAAGYHPNTQGMGGGPYGTQRPGETSTLSHSYIRSGPSPAPSVHHRGRSTPDDGNSRRPSSRPY
ncbi:hypothetical protein C8Q75DRAFT_722765 [Abortiporus biennis]|nr:hypothetical protein C8Q75DRAFT_722765 [Abortiporus biennis]